LERNRNCGRNNENVRFCLFFKVAIAGGASPGMEVWNPADGTVTLVTDELPPGVNVRKLFFFIANDEAK